MHDAPEYVIGDPISPFKAVIGGDYKPVESRLLHAISLRFGMPPIWPAALVKIVKQADRGAAFLEATRLAGFSSNEARQFFGEPPGLDAATEKRYLSPWGAELAEKRFLKSFSELASDPKHKGKS
jgi:5'-deoxynucleotidase YfbR-like HD superfamily hydrolase